MTQDLQYFADPELVEKDPKPSADNLDQYGFVTTETKKSLLLSQISL